MRQPWFAALLGLLLTLAGSAVWLYRADVLHRTAPALEISAISLQRTPKGDTLLLQGGGLSDSCQFLLSPDPGNSQRIVSDLSFGSRTMDIELFRHYALLANNDKGLRLIDIANPAQPAVVATLALPDSALGVAIRDNYAFVANNRAGLSVVSLGDPLRPELVGACALPGSAMRVALSGPLAYVACLGGGLQVVDISNPHAPKIVGSLANLGTIYDVALAGNFACLASGKKGLAIVDISDPRQPVLVAHQPLDGVVMEVQVRADGYAFASGVGTGLATVDVRMPSQPVLAGLLEINHRIYGLRQLDDFRLIACTMDGLLQLDATDPHRLQVQGEVRTHDEMRAVQLRGELAFLAGSNSFKVVDIAALQPLPQSFTTMVGTSPRLAMEGDELTVMAGGQLSTLIFQDNSLLPGTRPPIAFEREPLLLARQDSWAAVVDIAGILHLLDLDRPDTAAQTRLPLDGKARALALQLPLVFVGLEDGVQILRLEPGGRKLERLARLPLEEPVVEILAEGSWLYLANGRDGLHIVDIRQPQQPVLVASIAAQWPEKEFSAATGLAKQGNRLYLTRLRTGLCILDVSDPTQPRLLQVVPVPEMSLDVQVAGSTAYIRRQRDVALADISSRVAYLFGVLPGTQRSESIKAVADQLIVGHRNGTLSVHSLPKQLPSVEIQPGTLQLKLPDGLEPGPYMLQINNFRNGTTESVRRYLTL